MNHEKLNTQQDSSRNILLSLEYLKEEARREGNNLLYEIIQTACVLARMKENHVPEGSFQYVNRDLFLAAQFFLKFCSASKNTQRNVMNFLTE